MGVSFTTTPPSPAGVYGDITDIIAEMGSYNEQLAADPDNTKAFQVQAMQEQKAMAFADAVINDRLARNNFLTPATVSLPMLRIIFGKLGAWQLYQVRGLSDKKNPFMEKYEWAMAALDELVFANRGGFTRASGYSDAPVAAGPTVNSDGQPIQTPAYARPYYDYPFWKWG